MIFGKDKGEFDFDSFKNDVASAADPLVEAVNKYQPNPKKRQYKTPNADLHDSASLFFQAAADTLDKRSSSNNSANANNTEASGFSMGDTVKGMKLDKKAKQAGDILKDTLDETGKRGGGLLGFAIGAASSAQDSVKDAKLDKKLGKLAGDTSSRVADLKLDKKAAKAVTTLKLDKKAANLADQAGKQAKSLKLDKKAAALAGQVKDLKLDKKAGDLAGAITGSVKDAKLGDVAGTVGGVLLAAAATVGDSVKDARLDKKASDLADTVSGAVKDAQLDKRLAGLGEAAAPVVANVAETAGNIATSVAENVGSFIKDNKLDKKAAGVAGNVADSANSLMSLAGDKASQTLKDAKLDQKLASAQIPEKLFEYANIIPGVTVSNPKKAAKQFRKNRKKVFKAAGQQQKELAKTLAARQMQASKLLQAKSKDAQKFVDARRKDIATGKISVPFYQPPKKKGFNWGRTGLIAGGVGAVAGGLALNNARIWSAVPPLESKLPGENRYFRSRQGIVFYKETAQGAEGKAPVVFVHGIGAGNSSYEWLQNIGPIAEQHKVYAYDLLGFGNSDRPGIRYSAEVYIKQLTEFLDEVVKQPAYVVASSLGASYAVQVAYRRPELIQKLVLTSPTGINRVAGNNGVQLLPPFLYFLLRSPILGKAIYSGVASRNYIRSYMQNQMFYDKSLVTEDMIEQYYVAAHQPGAEYPAYSFFTGQLNAEIGQTLGRIDKPVLLVQGREDRQTSPEEGETLRRQNQAASLINLEGARLLPHWEKAGDFNKAVLDFLAKPDEPTTTKLSASDTSGVALGNTGDAQKSHDKAPGKADELAGKAGNTVSEVAGKVQDTLKDMAKKAPEAASQLADKARGLTGDDRQKVGEALEKAKSAAGNAEADFNVEEAAKKLSEKFAGQAKQEQPEASQQANKPKVKPLKIQPKTDSAQQAGANDAPEAAEYHDNVDIEQELKAHREAFIGDDDSGAALLEDKDNNNVDDRRMGNH